MKRVGVVVCVFAVLLLGVLMCFADAGETFHPGKKGVSIGVSAKGFHNALKVVTAQPGQTYDGKTPPDMTGFVVKERDPQGRPRVLEYRGPDGISCVDMIDYAAPGEYKSTKDDNQKEYVSVAAEGHAGGLLASGSASQNTDDGAGQNARQSHSLLGIKDVIRPFHEAGLAAMTPQQDFQSFLADFKAGKVTMQQAQDYVNLFKANQDAYLGAFEAAFNEWVEQFKSKFTTDLPDGPVPLSSNPKFTTDLPDGPVPLSSNPKFTTISEKNAFNAYFNAGGTTQSTSGRSGR